MRNSQWRYLFLLPLFLFPACNGEPKIASDAAGGALEAMAFNGEIYRTRNGYSTINLISRDELEYTTNGTTLLCKYSEQNDALRVIATMLGTQQVLYFRRVPGGLQSNDGILYLSRAGLAELQRQQELERKREQAARAAQERERVEASRQAAIDAQRQAEEQRLADAAERPLVAKQLVGRWGFQDNELAITRDASEFVVIAKYFNINTKETLRGELLPDNRLELTSVKIEALRPEFPPRKSRQTTWIKLQPDKASVEIEWENGGSDNRYRRLSENP